MSNWYDTIVNKVKTAIDNVYVKKENGKGLSTEDYTTAEKNKLSGLSNYTHPVTQQCNYSYTHPSTQQCTHTHTKSQITDLTTETFTITYTDGTTQTLTFLK